MKHDDKEYLVTQNHEITVGIRATGKNRIAILTINEQKEITLISRCHPQFHQDLVQIGYGETQ